MIDPAEVPKAIVSLLRFSVVPVILPLVFPCWFGLLSMPFVRDEVEDFLLRGLSRKNK